MIHRASPVPLRRLPRALALGLAAVLALGLGLSAQQAPAKKALTVDDYTRWRSISGQEISGDGKWVTYVPRSSPTCRPAETKPVLHLLNLETNQDVEVANATGGAFSADSKWIAYQVDPSGGRGGRGGRGGAGGARRRAGGRRDATAGADAGRPAGGQGGQGRRRRGANAAGAAAARRAAQPRDRRRFSRGRTFSRSRSPRTSTHLMLRRRPPTPAAAPARAARTPPVAAPAARRRRRQRRRGGAAAEPTGPRGVDVTVHNLTTGRDQLLGSVGDIVVQQGGRPARLHGRRRGEGQQRPVRARSRRAAASIALDNDAKVYNRLTWNDDGTALAVLKGVDVEKMRERDNVLVVYPERSGRARRRAASRAGHPRSRQGRQASPRAGW